MASQQLLSNVTVIAPITSPAVNFSGSGTSWTVDVSLSIPVNAAILYVVESAPAQTGPWTEVHRASETVTSGAIYTDKQGLQRDPTKPVETYSLNGEIGDWFRIKVISITGTVVVLSLTVVSV